MLRRLRHLAIFLLAVLPASAQDKGPRKLRAWFADGTGVEFDTETTGSTLFESHGGAVTGSDKGIKRVVLDKDGNPLYEYGIEAWAGPQPGTVTIRIKPLEAENQARLPKQNAKKDLAPPVATVAGVREFRGVQKGQAVRLEILYNPSTGEKIYDVLRPSTDAKPRPTALADSVPAVEELSFRDIALVVNGEKTSAPAGWITGAVARLYVPGHGAYFLSTYQPKTPQEFRHSVYADRNDLEFALDGDLIHITSVGNVLTLSENGIVWVYHDPKYRTQAQSQQPDLVVADKVESLLSK
jgi:hypothetical protein